jgi:hypothetical protein
MSPRLRYEEYYPRPAVKVYHLRKEGKIEEAHEYAVKLRRAFPDLDDVKTAYAWTLIDLCKKELAAENTETAAAWLAELSGLQFNPYDEFEKNIINQTRSLRDKMDPYSGKVREASALSKAGKDNEAYAILSALAREGHLSVDAHENYGWIIYRYLKNNIEALTSVQVRSVLRDYINLQNPRPSNLHSLILNFALAYSKKDPNFRLVSFLKLWGPENLTNDDFCDSVAQDGKKIPSLMSRIAREVARYPQAEVREFVELLPIRKDSFVEMLRENSFWNIYSAVSERRFKDAWGLFDAYNESYAHCGPSEYHSKVLDYAERVMKDENQWRFYAFFRNWGPESLRDVDWKEKAGENGHTYKGLGLKAIKKAYDALEGMNDDAAGDFTWLIDAHQTAVSKVPDDDWTVRSMALLLRRAGRMDEVEKIYKDLTLNLGDRYYIWNEFADCVADRNVKVGMMCKAISLERNEDFLGKIRLDMAEQLLAMDKKDAAALEIKLHKEHYQSKGWNLKQRVLDLEAACGQIDQMPSDNKALYDEFIPYAEEYAYSDIPFTNLVFVEEWTNPEGKKMQKYVSGPGMEVVVNSRRYPQLRRARLGQVWAFKLHHPSIEKTVPLIMKRTHEEDWSVLPLRYGYIDYVNEEKKVYHINNQDSDLIFCRYDQKRFKVGDYVVFRQYSRCVRDDLKVNVYSLRRSDQDVAIRHFKSAVVSVDRINNEKNLFHFEMGYGQPSGIIRYDQTDLRPAVGDRLRIHYYIRERKKVRRPGEDRRVVEVLKVEPLATN